MRPRIVDALNGVFGTQIFDWAIPGPAAIYAAAMLAVLIIFVRRSSHSGLSRYHALGAAFWTMMGGLVGARVFYLVQHLETTLGNPGVILNLGGGTASWGAYIGGAVAFLLYFSFNKEQTLGYADAVGSCLGLGIAVGRWSCFLNGDDFGTLSDLPWTVRFPHASPPFVAQVRAGLLDPLADLSLPIHPVQLYLSFNGLMLFLLATWCWRRLRHLPGATFYLYWLSYCLTRFMWEFFRGDQSRVFSASLTVPQVLAILVVIPTSLGLWWSLRGNRLKPSRTAFKQTP